MYTHAYSDYVNHILNKSPSKSTYTFPKAQRFPKNGGQNYAEQAYMQANGFQYSDGSRKRPVSPYRNAENFRNANKTRVQQLERPSSKSKSKGKRKSGGKNQSKSKSPIRQQLSTNKHFLNRQDRRYGQKNDNPNKRSEFVEKYSPSQLREKRKSASKSPSRSPNRRNKYSPSKTFTQQLYEIDHVSKNITINGYYPVGYELSPKGKYSNSKLRNTPAHTFGKSSSELRYNYTVRSEDPLGPGYYQQFSEFGPLKK